MTHTNEQCPMNPDRRRLLGKIVLGGAGIAGLASHQLLPEESILAARLADDNSGASDSVSVDALSGATRVHTNWAKFADLKKPLAKGKIGGLSVGRMILGGNLIGGWAHSRDLLYPSDLVRAYHTKEKIFATYKMAEACGINTYLGHFSQVHLCEEYWNKYNGSIQFFGDCRSEDEVKICADKGADACYINGERTDTLVREEKFDEIEKQFRATEQAGLISGLGAHRLKTVVECERRGYRPAFWMKTIHHHNYPSAKNVEATKEYEYYSIFCHEPDETRAFMQSVNIPWIGFKTLAAGAIHPNDGFRFAFESGADFLCVGMYDFQIVDDVNTCMAILDSPVQRVREWIG
ncbi:MAG: hypothetical protein ACRC46_06170 [Thermoguttaceae bacterium]